MASVSVCRASRSRGNFLTLQGYIVSVDDGEGAAGAVICAHLSPSSSPAQDTALSRR
jgi:hypothetical protein